MADGAGRRRKSIGARRNPASAGAILDAAEAVLAEAGYSGFSIEAVARRARAGKPTIYRWWPSKAALLLEVYQRQKRVAVPDTGRLEDDLAGFLKSLLPHWRETSSGSVFRSSPRRIMPRAGMALPGRWSNAPGREVKWARISMPLLSLTWLRPGPGHVS
jgi:AcrR family transcriptional regulator